MSSVSHPRVRAFTLLELATVILVVSILVVLLVPVIGGIQRRLEKTRCIGNLKSLHIATASYVQDRHSWPQIPITYGQDQKALAIAWIAALKPYNIAQINWVCPTVQKNLIAPDLSKDENARIDYSPFPYGRNPQDPFRYANQPWFIESGDIHGNGNLMIFPDGHSEELVDFLRRMKQH